MNNFIAPLERESNKRQDVYEINNKVLNIEERLSDIMYKLTGSPTSSQLEKADGPTGKTSELKKTPQGFFEELLSSDAETVKALFQLAENLERVHKTIRILGNYFDDPTEGKAIQASA